MEWIADPTAWAGLFTLVLLELMDGHRVDQVVMVRI